MTPQKEQPWLNVGRVPISEGYEYRLAASEREILIQRQRTVSVWEDITSECVLQPRVSVHNGVYYLLVHDKNTLAFMSPFDCHIETVKDYKIEKPQGASLSFRVFHRDSR